MYPVTPSFELSAHRGRERQPIEYIDRPNYHTICVAEFEPVNCMDDLQPGDRIIWPQSVEMACLDHWDKWNHNNRYEKGYLDADSLYPIIMKVLRVDPTHVRVAEYGDKPAARLAWDLLWKMSNPN